MSRIGETGFQLGSGDLTANLRKAAIGVGLAIIGLGVVLLNAPEAVPQLSFQYVFVTFLGYVAFLQGAWMIRRRWKGSIVQDHPPDFERPLSGALPGADVDRMILEMSRRGQGQIEYREQLRERLVETAIGVLRQSEKCTREEAITLLEEGDWTDNTEAAAFFSGKTLPGISLEDRVRNWMNDRTAYERRVQNAIDALMEISNLSIVDIEDATQEEWVGRRLATAILAVLGASSSRRDGRPQRVDWDGEEIRYHYGEAYAERRTHRWLGVSAFAFVLFGFGIISFQPSLLVAGSVGLVYAGYSRATTAPNLDALDVDRTISDENPAPGDAVTVTVQVHNGGDALVSDLRLVDAVPGPISVVDGSPRFATALRPGKTMTFRYEIEARRGEYEWPLYVIGRDASGEAEAKTTKSAGDGITCLPRLTTEQSMPVRTLTTLFTGEIATDTGGDGLEFHVERKYQPNDPLSRIDWNQYARTGEFATIDYRQERSVNAVLLFDTRESAYLTPSADSPHAVDRSVTAATTIFSALFDRGDQVGVAAFDTIPAWLAPGADDEHRERARRLFGTHPALSSIPPTSGKGYEGYVDPLTHVQRQLSMHTQIVLFSPLCDSYPANVAEQLDASNHPITVVSPDPTLEETVGHRLVRVERWIRIATLRERGVRVIDWPLDKPLGVALEEASQRW